MERGIRNNSIVFICSNSSVLHVIARPLYRIHEALLHFVEDDYAQDQQNDHEDKTVDEPAPADEITSPQETILEGFDDRGDGVQTHELMDRNPHPDHVLCLAKRIHDRRSIHPQGDDEREQDLQVAVLGRHRRDDETKTQGEAGHHRNQDRE